MAGQDLKIGSRTCPSLEQSYVHPDPFSFHGVHGSSQAQSHRQARSVQNFHLPQKSLLFEMHSLIGLSVMLAISNGKLEATVLAGACCGGMEMIDALHVILVESCCMFFMNLSTLKALGLPEAFAKP